MLKNNLTDLPTSPRVKFYRSNEKRKPINKALFEVWSVSLANLPDSARKALTARKNQVLNSFVKLLNTDADFEKSISTGTGEKRNVTYRFKKVAELIEEIVTDD